MHWWHTRMFATSFCDDVRGGIGLLDRPVAMHGMDAGSGSDEGGVAALVCDCDKSPALLRGDSDELTSEASECASKVSEPRYLNVWCDGSGEVSGELDASMRSHSAQVLQAMRSGLVLRDLAHPTKSHMPRAAGPYAKVLRSFG